MNKNQSNSCSFCEQYILKTKRSFWSKYGKKYGQFTDIILDTDQFLAMTGLGALTEGYLLIIPKRHYRSIGAIPEEKFAELSEFCEKIRKIIEHLYGPVVLFEHGMSKCHFAGGCIDHAHIHFIPCTKDFRSTLQNDFKEKKIENYDELSEFTTSHTPYFFYENARREKYVYNVHKDVPSQYFRRLWAESIGRPNEWDWGVFIGEENIARTINKIHGYLSSQSDDAT